MGSPPSSPWQVLKDSMRYKSELGDMSRMWVSAAGEPPGPELEGGLEQLELEQDTLSHAVPPYPLAQGQFLCDWSAHATLSTVVQF